MRGRDTGFGDTAAEPLGAMLDFVDPDGIQLEFLFLESKKSETQGYIEPAGNSDRSGGLVLLFVLAAVPVRSCLGG